MEPSSNGHAEHRYVVKGDLEPGSITSPVDRSGMKKRFAAVFVVSLWSRLISSCHSKVGKNMTLSSAILCLTVCVCGATNKAGRFSS